MYFLLLFASAVSEPIFKIAVTYNQPEEVILQTPTSVAMDEQGSLYLLDSSTRSVIVWDAAGRYKQSIGSQGQGPGEITMSDRVGTVAVNARYLVVIDNKIEKIHFWDRAGVYRKTIAKPTGLGRVFHATAYADGFVISSSSSDLGNQRLLFVDENFETRHLLAEVGDNMYSRNKQGRWDYHPFAEELVIGFGRDVIWWGNSYENAVFKLDTKGSALKQIRLKIHEEDLAQEDKAMYLKSFEGWRKPNDTIAFPDKAMLLNYIMPMEKNLLVVFRYPGEGAPCKGQVLNRETGAVLARFNQALGFYVFTALNSKLISVATDEQGDYQVRTMRVALPN